MAITKLVIPIDADLTGLRKGIREAGRVMRASSRELGDTALQMSRAISVPLLAIGVGAVKMGAEFNQLRDAMVSTMTGAGSSISRANEELKALQKEARAPGLDMEQAVKGSVRLQSAGLAAESARRTLREFGNEIARTGGAAPQLDAVTKQFSQMLGKGRILQEDMSIIAENMPSVSQEMQKAFGTANVERIRETGITVEQFIMKLTASMAKNGRAAGGLANDMTNFFNDIKMGAADLGNVINDRLRVGEALSGVGDFIRGLAEGFTALSPKAQSVVLAVGAFAVALGPAIKVGSMMVNTVIGMSASFAQMRLSMAAVESGGFIGWWQRLNAVVKANYIGVAVAVVLALAAAIAVYSRNNEQATRIAEDRNAIEKEANTNIAEQRVRTGLLIDVLKAENTTKAEKLKALKELQAISPEYFKGLSVEKSSVDAINIAYDRYIDNILRAARAKAAENKLIELDSKIQDLNAQKEKLIPTVLQAGKSNINQTDAFPNGAVNFDVVGKADAIKRPGISANGMDRENMTDVEAGRAAEKIRALTEETAAYNEQMDALKETIRANKDVTATLTNGNKELAGVTDEAKAKIKTYKEALADVRKELDKAGLQGADAFEAQVDAISRGLDKLLDAGYGIDSPQVKSFTDMMKSLRASIAIGPVAPIAAAKQSNSVTSETAGAAPAIPEGMVQTTQQLLDGLRQYKTLAEELGAINTDLGNGILSIGEAWKSVVASLNENTPKAQNLIVSMADAIAGSVDAAVNKYAAMIEASKAGGISAKENAAAVKAGFSEMANSAVKAGAKVVQSYIQQMVARAALSAMQFVPFPFNIAASVVAGAAASAAAGMLMSRIPSIKLAKGGIAYGETVATIGEYPGARNNPEIVAPLNKLPGLLGNSFGAQKIELGGNIRISGSDLLYVVERAQQRENRIR